MTPVILRRFKTGTKELVALLPDQLADLYGNVCIYSQGGQRIAANYHVVMANTVRAYPESPEGKALLASLGKTYSDLKHCLRQTSKHRQELKNQLADWEAELEDKVNAAEIRDRLETETRERLKGRFMVGPALPPSSEYSNCLRIQVSPLSSNRVYVLAVDEHQTTLEIRLSAPNSNQLALLDLIPQLDKLA